VSRLRFIRRTKGLGFSLKEVGELCALRSDPSALSADFKRRAAEKIAANDAKIRDLKRTREALILLAEACPERGPVGDCPILEAIDRFAGE
jgi:MerR family transcriptional regulator, copper efflux regulator